MPYPMTSALSHLSGTLVETLNGSSVSRYVHGPRGIHAQKDASANWEWLLADGLGSVRLVVDNSGSVLESRQYDPYGGAFGTTGTTQTNYGFTGEQRAGNTELMYLRARYYATNSGAFVSSDLLESVNRYAYASGNPVNRVDLNGLQDFGVDCPVIFVDGIPLQLCGLPIGGKS